MNLYASVAAAENLNAQEYIIVILIILLHTENFVLSLKVQRQLQKEMAT